MKSKFLTIVFLLVATVCSAQSWVQEDFRGSDTSLNLSYLVVQDSTVTVWADKIALSGNYYHVEERKVIIDTPIVIRTPWYDSTLHYKEVKIKYFSNEKHP